MATNKLLLSTALVMILLISGCQKKTVNLIQYANPLIGTGKSTGPVASSHTQGPQAWGQVIPAVSTPFGMTQWTPQTCGTEELCVAPYYYTGKKIQGFRGSHWLGGSCTQDYGSFTIMPMTGYLRTFANERASTFDHENEVSTPAYYSCMLQTYTTFVEMTGTARAGFFRFSYLKKSKAIILVTPNSDQGQGYIKIDPEKQEIYGYNPVSRLDKEPGHPAGFSGFFVVRFNKAFTGYGCSFQMEDHKNQTEIVGKADIGAYAAFDIQGDEVIMAKAGTSFTSIEAARANLDAEIPHWNFEKTKAETEQLWNQTFSAVQLKGGKTEDYTTFYTALYHAMLFPRTFSDVDGSYPGFDGNKTVLKMEKGHVYYDDFLLPDTRSAQLPLVSLLAPDKYEDMMKSLALKAGQGGEQTNIPLKNNYTLVLQGMPGSIDPGMDKNKMHEKLDSLFNSKDYWHSNGQYLTVPYLYNFLGDHVETQKKVKNILTTEYNNYDGGIPGNDNAGQTSAWYVFSAMGLYPVAPGSGEYQLSSPIFNEVELTLNPKYYPGKRFTIIAEDQDSFNTYNTVKLNNKENPFVLKHEDLRFGGKLKFSNSKR